MSIDYRAVCGVLGGLNNLAGLEAGLEAGCWGYQIGMVPGSGLAFAFGPSPPPKKKEKFLREKESQSNTEAMRLLKTLVETDQEQ